MTKIKSFILFSRAFCLKNMSYYTAVLSLILVLLWQLQALVENVFVFRIRVLLAY